MRFLLEMLSQALNAITGGDPDLFATAWRTVRLAVAATAVAGVVGLPLGVLIGQARPRRRRLGFILANAGLGLPAVMLGSIVFLLALPSSVLGFLDLYGRLWGVFVVQVVFAFPILVALTATAVADLPPGLFAQARAFGAGRGARGLLAVREARIGVTAAVITAIGASVGEVAAVVIIGGNLRGETNTLTSTVLIDMAAGRPGAATADVLVLLAIVAVLGVALTVVQQRGRRAGVVA
ncbi:MAG: ABC transporter permease [Solirubrobacteraceae bacterium]